IATITRLPKSDRQLKAESGTLVKTRAIGGGGGVAFEDMTREQYPLIGAHITTKPFGPHLVIRSIQLIYQTPAGKKESSVYGWPDGSAKRVQAKEGYAVGGLVLRTGERVDGLKFIFMRLTGDRLDAKDSYHSEWFGGTGGGESVLGGDGKLVVGLHGRFG